MWPHLCHFSPFPFTIVHLRFLLSSQHVFQHLSLTALVWACDMTDDTWLGSLPEHWHPCRTWSAWAYQSHLLRVPAGHRLFPQSCNEKVVWWVMFQCSHCHRLRRMYNHILMMLTFFSVLSIVTDAVTLQFWFLTVHKADTRKAPTTSNFAPPQLPWLLTPMSFSLQFSARLQKAHTVLPWTNNWVH